MMIQKRNLSLIAIALLVLASTLASSSDASAIDPGACHALFADDLQVAQAAVNALPKKLVLPDTVEIKKLANLAFGDFSRNFPIQEVEEATAKIAVRRAGEISPRQYRFLKGARKSSQIIRSVFYVLTEAHQPPTEFDEIVREFGKMIGRAKRSIDPGNKDQRSDEKKALKQAKSLLQRLQNGYGLLSAYKIEISSGESTLHFVERLKAEMRRLLQAPDVSVDEYHDLRKWVRDLKVIFDLRNELEPSSVNQSVADFFESLNSDFGDAKDELKDDEDALGAAGLLRTQIDLKFKIQIEAFLSRIESRP